jgi:hypothetical protein
MSGSHPGPEIAAAFKDFLVGLRGFEPMCIADRFSADTNRRGVDGSMYLRSREVSHVPSGT